jgi:bacterioferritin-associated ferredoxin
MIVCVCNAIREDELRAAAREGASTPRAAFKALGCDPQCGCCLDCVREVIDEERDQPARRKSNRVVIQFPQAA